jgi:hypothetical protein
MSPIFSHPSRPSPLRPEFDGARPIRVAVRLKRTLMRGRALFAVQIDSAFLLPVTASFEMTLQDGMRRALPSSLTVRPTATVSSEIVGMLESGERPVALVTRVHGEGLDLEIISNVDHGPPPNWPLAVAGVAIPATSALLAWYFARHATRNATAPQAALPKPAEPAGTTLALASPPQTDFHPPAAQTMFPALVDVPPQTTQPPEPIRVGHDRVGQKRLRRIVEPSPPAAPWPVGAITSTAVGKAALRTLGLALTAAVTAISAIAAIAYVHPQIAELAMPAPIPRGSHVDVLYRLAGFGTGDYSLVDADGTPLDSGTLATNHGVLRIDVPSHLTGRPVTLRVVMTGPFGDARRELSADVLATPAPASVARANAGPHIEMFSLDRDTVSGGDLLAVRYHVVPSVGAVLVTDATGAVLASAALTPSGKSLLRIPPSDRNRDVAVVLRATGLGGGVETRVPLHIEPGPRANAPTTTSVASPGFGGVSSASDDNEVAVLTPRVVSGEPIRLHVPLPYDRLTISLLDPQRRVVAERQYAAAYDPVRIEAPNVSVPTTFELHASVEHGVAVNIGVYRVVVVPAGHAAH